MLLMFLNTTEKNSFDLGQGNGSFEVNTDWPEVKNECVECSGQVRTSIQRASFKRREAKVDRSIIRTMLRTL